MIMNNENKEVSSYGILCSRIDKEVLYGNKQLWITGNTIAFTDDNWKSVKMAIGETTLKNLAKFTRATEYRTFSLPSLRYSYSQFLSLFA